MLKREKRSGTGNSVLGVLKLATSRPKGERSGKGRKGNKGEELKKIREKAAKMSLFSTRGTYIGRAE